MDCKETPLLPLNLCYLEKNKLVNVDAIRIMSCKNQALIDNIYSFFTFLEKKT